ncbi:MAG: aldo/keto reductase [Chromatiales bacterium]|nr:aldo/keto reductase [Chromatiales bacterium]
MVPVSPLGDTGIYVPRLGLGCQPLGLPEMHEDDVGRLLDMALEAGVNLLDTAPAYGLSEERLGRHLAGRRGDVILVTKLGYGVPGCPDWTGECIRRGVDLALERLQTDYLDIALLHSCGLETLEQSEVVEALEKARAQGKLRLAGYSGENNALEFAIASGAFQVIETSVNFLDQAGMDGAVKQAGLAGLGVLAKRPLANAVWRHRVTGDEAVEEYRRRYEELRPCFGEPVNWPDTALRFAAFAPNVHCALIGTGNVEHLRSAIAAVATGPLPYDLDQNLREVWRRNSDGWGGVI